MREPEENLWLASAALLLISILAFPQFPPEIFAIYCSASSIVFSAARLFRRGRGLVLFASLALAGNLLSLLLFLLASFQPYPRSLSFLLVGAYSFFGFFAAGAVLGGLFGFSGSWGNPNQQ